MPTTPDDGVADGHEQYRRAAADGRVDDSGVGAKPSGSAGPGDAGTDESGADDMDSAASRLGRVIAAASRVPVTAPATLASWAGTATDVVNAARTNKGMVADLVRLEVERVVGALGLVTPTEVVALRKRVSDLERQVARLEAAAAQPARTAAARSAARGSVAGAAVGRAAAQQTAKKSATKTAKKTTSKRAPTKRTAAKRTPKKPSP